MAEWFNAEKYTTASINTYMKGIGEKDIEQIVEMYKHGKSSDEIAEIYNVYPYSIIKVLKQNSIPLRKRGLRKGTTPWNKDKSFKLENTLKALDSTNFKSLNEATIRKHVKRFLIHKNGNICQICNNSVWNNKPIPLICDHIDGNSLNNEINNFRLVCPNCDAQLPTFKSKNIGNGRKYDREYHKGSSPVGRGKRLENA